MMRMGVPAVVGAAGVLLCSLTGCYDYAYRPEVNATAQLAGRPAAIYEVPSTSPVGDVRIASMGITKIRQNNTGLDVKAMHVRMVVANNGTRNWAIDTRDVIADFRGLGDVRPVFVVGPTSELPQLTVPPLQKRTVDLYFPLPPGATKARRIPEFDVVWRLSTGTTVVAQRTPFERIIVEPVVYAAGYGAWGLPYYWSDPWFGAGYLGPPYVWY